MSFFTTDHKEAGGFEPVKPGNYEVVISKAEVKPFNSGNHGVAVELTIRTDVDQPEQKRKVFDNLVATEKAMFKFQQVAKAVGMAEGVAVPSLEAFAKMILFKAVKVKITNAKDNYQGEDRIVDRVANYTLAGVPYGGGGAGSPTHDPFAVPGGADPFAAEPTGNSPFGGDGGEDFVPPWEQGGDEQEPVVEAEKPKRGKAKKEPAADPFADDGKPIDISEDDLPFV